MIRTVWKRIEVWDALQQRHINDDWIQVAKEKTEAESNRLVYRKEKKQ